MRSRPEYDPRCRTPPDEWSCEPAADALGRCPSFGRRFFDALFVERPDLAAAAGFLRWSRQADDVVATFDLPGGGFGVQIDPDLEVIVVWDGRGQSEHGGWSGDQVPSALDRVRTLLAKENG